MALSLKGLKKEGFIGFDNPALMRSLMLGCGPEKAMSPQEGRVLADAALHSRLPDGQSIDQGFAVSRPSVGFAQMRQRGGRQGIAGALAGAAAVTAQSTTPTPGSQFRRPCVAVRAMSQIRQGLPQSIWGGWR